MKTSDGTNLKRKAVHDVFFKVHDLLTMIFFDQIGQFPKLSQQGNKYITVMVEINRNAIIMELITSCTDAKLHRAYQALMLRIKQASIVPPQALT